MIAAGSTGTVVLTLLNQEPAPPSGGQPLDRMLLGCNDYLTSGLVMMEQQLQNGHDVNEIIRVIQERRPDDCTREQWAPVVRTTAVQDADWPPFEACGPRENGLLGSEIIPWPELTEFLDTAKGKIPSESGEPSPIGFYRDRTGRMLVEFLDEHRPHDGTQCWLYLPKVDWWTSIHGRETYERESRELQQRHKEPDKQRPQEQDATRDD